MSDTLDGFGLWIKEPDLSLLSSVHGFDHKVSSTDYFDNSLHWHSRSDIEWSSKVKSEWLVEAGSLVSFSFVAVSNRPFLIDFERFLRYSNGCTFRIIARGNF